MRFNNIVYQKIRFAGLLLIVFLFSVPVNAQAQKEKKARQVLEAVLKIVDESGTPIPNANVVVGEGLVHTQSAQDGTVTFKSYPESIVTISAPLYEPKISTVIELIQNATVTLGHAKMYMTSDDDVALPFTTIKKRFLTGPETVIDGSYFSHYPSTDIRNSLTGISSMYDIRELDGSPGVHPMEGYQNLNLLSTSTMGATDKFGGMPYVMVDNVPVDLQEYVLDPAEIESATLVKGILGTTMYGPAATGGVLYIKTKIGMKNERMLHIDIENGISTVDRMPSYVSGSEFAQLQNTAKANSGILTGIYSNQQIAGFANNDPYDLKYPSTDFQDMMLDKTKEFRRVNMSSSGGNDIIQYNSYLGYAGEGDIINMGAKSDYNRITTRQNVNVKINDQFTALFGFYGNLSFRRSPSYGYDPEYTSENTDNATLTINELPSILNDIHSTPPVAYPIYAFTDTTTKPPTPWYGVSALYNNNLIGNIKDQGFYTDRGRTGASYLKLIYDADKFIKGLKSITSFGFNIHNLVRVGKTNDYLSYNVDTATLALTRNSSHSLIKQTDLLKLMDYYFQRYSFNEVLSYDRQFANSTLQSTLTYNQLLTYINGVEEPQRARNTAFSMLYTIKDKYSLQGVLNYAGTSVFDKDYRNILNWAFGGGYVISDEAFMSNMKAINYLKIRAQGGVAGNESFYQNLFYVDRWSSTSSTSTSTLWGFGPLTSSPTWFGSVQDNGVNRSYLSRTGNPVLTWEKRKEFNAGFDAVLFNNSVTLNMTYYNWLVDGSISQVSNILPFLAGYNGARPYLNYNQTRYNALGLDFTYTKKVGQAIVVVGGNATTAKGMRVKYDQPDYRFDYQDRIGKPSDAIFGQHYLGKFASDDEALVVPQLFDAVLKEGDLKYEDMNSDGVVDDLDQSMIGHSSPRLYYGVNIAVKYKNFDLFVLGSGRAFYDVALNNPYYWNGWYSSDGSNNNYSTFTRDNIGGAYPRLTYNKVNNNFILSEFWLTKGDFFKIQNVELGYTIPAHKLQFMAGRAVRIYVRGANLLTFSQLKDVDPETIYTGNVNGNSTNLAAGVNVYPLFKTISAGVKLNF
jgi:TonB-linked SusC/RagA family outer membrane protein